MSVQLTTADRPAVHSPPSWRPWAVSISVAIAYFLAALKNPASQHTPGALEAYLNLKHDLQTVIAEVHQTEIHIMKLVGFRNRVLVLVQWAGSYFTYQRSVRLITGREAGYVRPPVSTPAVPPRREDVA